MQNVRKKTSFSPSLVNMKPKFSFHHHQLDCLWLSQHHQINRKNDKNRFHRTHLQQMPIHSFIFRLTFAIRRAYGAIVSSRKKTPLSNGENKSKMQRRHAIVLNRILYFITENDSEFFAPLCECGCEWKRKKCAIFIIFHPRLESKSDRL